MTKATPLRCRADDDLTVYGGARVDEAVKPGGLEAERSVRAKVGAGRANGHYRGRRVAGRAKQARNPKGKHVVGDERRG